MSKLRLVQISHSPLNPNLEDSYSKSLFFNNTIDIENSTMELFEFSDVWIKEIFDDKTEQLAFQERKWDNLFFLKKRVDELYSYDDFIHDLEVSSNNKLIFSAFKNSKPFHRARSNSLTNYEEFIELKKEKNTSCRVLEIDRISRSNKLKLLKNLMGNWLNSYVHITAFYSSPGQSVIPMHWDTENLFIYQVQGKKDWIIARPEFEWPLRMHNPGSFKKEYNDLSEDAYKITLEEGDFLYVPRGWFHMATANEEGSTHITFGIATPTLLDYISESIDASLWSMSKNNKFRKLINKNTDTIESKEVLKKSLNEIMDNIENISNNNFTQQWKLNYPLGRRDDVFLIYKDMENIFQNNHRFSVLGDSFNSISKCKVSGDNFLLLEGYKLIGEVEHLKAIQRVLGQESLTVEDLLAVIDDNTLIERVISQLLQMGCVMFKND